MIAPAPSLTPGELPAVCEPSLPCRPGSLASDSSEESAARRLVDLDHRVALPALDGDGDDLLREPALVGRGDRALVRAQRPAVHVGARDLELVADLGGLLEHLLAREGVGEPVVDHRVERLDVAHAEAEAGVREQVRRLRHRLHAAADADLHVARADRLVEQPDRADARSADLVDRLRGDLDRDAGLDLGLARGDLADARLQDLAHHHVLHLLRRDVGALERGADGDAAEVGRVQRGKAAAHLADGCPGAAEDDGAWHSGSSSEGRH